MRHHALEHVAAVAEVGVGWIRKAAVQIGLRAVLVEDADELADASRHRLQQQRVDEREDRGVGADPQREHADRDGGESRRTTEQTKAVAEILKQHAGPRSYYEDQPDSVHMILNGTDATALSHMIVSLPPASLMSVNSHVS